jgi:hypothetical protein
LGRPTIGIASPLKNQDRPIIAKILFGLSFVVDRPTKIHTPIFIENLNLNPIDLENWSYGWSLSVQRHSPDPRFFEKTWDLIVSRNPKPRKA